MDIKRVISANERITIGYDEFNQLCKVERKKWKDGQEYTTGTMVTDIRGKACFICKRVWTDDPDEWNYECLDVCSSLEDLKKARYVHPTCYLGHLNIAERNTIENIVCNCRDHLRARIPYEINAIPNEYGGGYDTDWYIVGFPESKPLSKIKFGRRRRVWVVELFSDEEFVIPQTYPGRHPVAGLLDHENVTKFIEPKRIQFHAHTKAKAEQYIEALLRLVVEPEPQKAQPGDGDGPTGTIGIIG